MSSTRTEAARTRSPTAAERRRYDRTSRSRRKQRGGRLAVHGALILYSVLALGPIAMIVMNSMKTRRAIFESPFAPPTADTLSFSGYESVFNRADFVTYFSNSIVVTLASVLLTVLLGAMAAFALTEYKVRIAPVLLAYLALGIMIPIRLGTVSILRMMVSLQLVNSLTALILVYTAMGLPLAVFILTLFFKQVPTELKEAARVDGASEYRVFGMALPLVRPGLAAIAVFTMLPIWNDLWFPLILTPGESSRTVTLGAQLFLGQFVSDWNAVLASLSLAIAPILVLYLLFSRYLVRGLIDYDAPVATPRGESSRSYRPSQYPQAFASITKPSSTERWAFTCGATRSPTPSVRMPPHR
jgi:raffinose/stachyose/melibiose transport system permease protein